MSNNDSVFHSDPEILDGESINDFLEGFLSEKWKQVIQLPPRSKPSPSNWWKRCRGGVKEK